MKQIIQIIRLLRPYWRFMGQTLLVGIMMMLFQIPGPYFTKLLIDDVYPHRDFTLLAFAMVLGAVFSIGIGGVSFLSSYFGSCVGTHMAWDFQSRFYRHIQALDFSFFDNRETGEILARFGDMKQSITSVIGLINSFILNVLKLIIFPPILFFIDWRLALISIAVLPFDTILVFCTKKYMRKLSQKIAERSADVSAKNFESLSGIRTIQALGLELFFFRKVQSLFKQVTALKIKSALFQGGSGFVGTIIRTGGTLAYGWYGWTQVLSGNLSMGTYMAFTGYVGFLYGPISNLIGMIRQIELTLVHTNRFFEIYDLRPAVRDNPSLPLLTNVRGEIGFHNVSFSYTEKKSILFNVDFSIPAKSTVALVGRSGSGKSTLVKMIPRFYDPQEGFVSIDGQDIRQLSLKSLRQHIGFAMQGSCLLQGSIRENLTFGRDIPLRDIEDATRAAHIHDFVESLQDGYDSVVGERGTQLSEGQKQRIALARVLIHNSPIMLLDEPTAALDLESEWHVQNALQTIRHGRTVVVIAHRLATIQNVDEIIVLNQGRIAEIGPHEVLKSQNSIYAKLCAHAASI